MQQRVPEVPKTIRARELAEALGVHRNTIWRWSKQGRLPKPVKLSHRVTAWDRAEVVALFPVLASAGR